MVKYSVLLIAPRYNVTAKKNYDYQFITGISYISAVLKKAGYQVDCLNLNHFDGTMEEIIKQALDKKTYDFVGTGSNALGYGVTETIINAVKAHPSKPRFILGGPIITTEPYIIFEALKPDFGVIGEGEETIVELLEYIEKNKDLNKVKGIIFRDKEGKIIKTLNRDPIKDLDSIPYPDYEGIGFEEWLDNQQCNFMFCYNCFDHPRIYPILASRSCPNQCTFCYHETRYRARSMDNVMKEIDWAVKKYRINLLLIYDECFAVNKEKMQDFCKRIDKFRKEIPWDFKWTCQLMVNGIDKGLIKMMKDCGCDTINYGFESYSPTVLKSMKKPITPQAIDKAFKLSLGQLGIQANFICGDVAETKETAKETLDYYKNHAQGQIGVGFIQPYPGSEIYAHCIKKGIIKDKLDFIKNQLTNRLYLNMTDAMTDSEIEELKEDILRSFSQHNRFINPSSMKKIKPHVYSIDVICPFCNQKLQYNNCYIGGKISYGFSLICRNCRMRFFVVSPLQKLGYKYYPQVRPIRDAYLKTKKTIKNRFI